MLLLIYSRARLWFNKALTYVLKALTEQQIPLLTVSKVTLDLSGYDFFFKLNVHLKPLLNESLI